MIEFRKITHENLHEIINLTVAENQSKFVSSNSASIMDAYVAITNDGIALPFGIYADEKAIGFIMFTYGHKKDESIPEIAYHNYCIWRFMIDAKYQRQGYGKAAILKAVKYMRSFPCGTAEYCWLNYEQDNIAAKTFYKKCGFKETEQRFYEEIVAILAL